MPRLLWKVLLVAALWLSIPASSVSATDSGRDLAAFFSGHLRAKGQFQNFVDGSRRSVTVDIRGRQTKAGFEMIERTVYSDGERLQKRWLFTKIAEGRYRGQRADLIGEASVDAKGQTVELNYVARVPGKDGKVRALRFQETFTFKGTKAGSYVVRVWFAVVAVGEARLSVRKLD